MKLAIGITALVVAVAAAVLLTRLPARTHLTTNQTIAATHTNEPDDLAALKLQAECMYRVLTTIPGVKEPKLGMSTRESQLWDVPFVEYLGTWEGGVISVRFNAIKAYVTDYTGYSFVFGFVGRVPPGFDESLLHTVMQAWKTSCHTRAYTEVN
jgi:hypothetical protein